MSKFGLTRDLNFIECKDLIKSNPKKKMKKLQDQIGYKLKMPTRDLKDLTSTNENEISKFFLDCCGEFVDYIWA